LPHVPLVFAPPPGANHPLAISSLHAWRLREPVSGRRYTVVKLTSQGGSAGYGEGGPATAAAIAEARETVAGRRATDSEFIRHRLAALPNMEAAVNNAMLDLVSRSKGVTIYQYLGGPTRFKARLLGQLEPTDEAASLDRSRRQGIRAFTMAVPPRESMSLLQAWVDHVRKRIADMQNRGGEGSEWVLDGAASMSQATQPPLPLHWRECIRSGLTSPLLL
jgi:L-alanine-DL-glutamate epimerase-like enolase superfamily enzyme